MCWKEEKFIEVEIEMKMEETFCENLGDTSSKYQPYLIAADGWKSFLLKEEEDNVFAILIWIWKHEHTHTLTYQSKFQTD